MQGNYTIDSPEMGTVRIFHSESEASEFASSLAEKAHHEAFAIIDAEASTWEDLSSDHKALPPTGTERALREAFASHGIDIEEKPGGLGYGEAAFLLFDLEQGLPADVARAYRAWGAECEADSLCPLSEKIREIEFMAMLAESGEIYLQRIALSRASEDLRLLRAKVNGLFARALREASEEIQNVPVGSASHATAMWVMHGLPKLRAPLPGGRFLHAKAPIIPTVVIFSRSREYHSPSRRSSSSASSPGSGGGDGDDDSGGSDPEPPAVTLCFKTHPHSSFPFSIKQTHSTGQGPRFEGRWL